MAQDTRQDHDDGDGNKDPVARVRAYWLANWYIQRGLFGGSSNVLQLGVPVEGLHGDLNHCVGRRAARGSQVVGCELALVVERRLCDAAVAGEQLGQMESPKATCTINCAAARPGLT